ncbi:hypothetical protein EV175_002771 [Coemansia sp. RSA 1933]|nr:hypothetical protein EV175_002771 [Coemansia sp. RSA 1933]
MDGNASHIFNGYHQADTTNTTNSQQQQPPVAPPAFSDNSMQRAASFSSPSSANTSTQSVAGSATPQMASKDVSLSLLQALLKPPAPPTTQTFSSTVPEQKSVLQQNEVPTQPGGIQGSVADSTKQSPMEQLKRMIALQGNGTVVQQQYQSSSPMQAGQQSNPLSAYSSPHVDTESDATFSTADATPTNNADDAPSVSGGNTRNGNNNKKKRPLSMNIDARKIKLRAKPEILPISLLPQPARFRAGRLISVSREYICYAVRSKEGGRIRVIHQMLGKLAKMQGHTDSIIDLAFHPCSRDDGMLQILASLGKDNRLIVWLVGPVDLEADSPEGAIAYEPFIDVDSGGDSRFMCLAWRSSIDADAMELCVGTDKGFITVKAPVPSSRGKRPDIANNGMNIMSVATDSAVTAIERAGSQWVVVATADKRIRVYELDSHWESCSQPHRIVCELARGEHQIETLIYVAPATPADGAGHLIVGSLMNKVVQLWWLGHSSSQIELLQTVSFVGAPSKPAPAFVKLSWAETGRCLTAGASYAPSGIFVFKTHGTGVSMALGFPQGYPLGNDQPTLNLYSAIEAPSASNGDNNASGSVLSIYGVQTRQIQQLQINGFRPVDHQALPDPASIYAIAPLAAEHSPAPAKDAPPVENPSVEMSVPVAAAAAPRNPVPPADPTTDTVMYQTLASTLSSQLADALGSLNLHDKKHDLHRAVSLDAQAEEKIVERISAAVETRVIQGMATVMEQTLIPAYNRATAAMFEQMQTTFESGLREWWTRFAQMMPPPPPPPHIATPLSHMAMMSQQPPAQSIIPPSNATSTDIPAAALQMHQQQQIHHQQQSQPVSMPIPRPTSNISFQGPMAGNMPSMHPHQPPAVSSPNVNHIESLRNILNLPPPPPPAVNNAQPQAQPQYLPQQQQ